MILLCNIWNCRNRWVHSNQLIPARLVSEYAQLIQGDFVQVNDGLVNRSLLWTSRILRLIGYRLGQADKAVCLRRTEDWGN
ncbi:hypothetical protein V6N12_000848 [Hibiscus sabdariffa]|uniref:Uncharacterized protein n=1 Tax=Hibiscus sabdariffa TaxID=183260 RepID=A0ABR2BZ66_9ROSI